MAWATGKLSDVAIRTAKPATGLRKLSDGKGARFLLMAPGGGGPPLGMQDPYAPAS